MISKFDFIYPKGIKMIIKLKRIFFENVKTTLPYRGATKNFRVLLSVGSAAQWKKRDAAGYQNTTNVVSLEQVSPSPSATVRDRTFSFLSTIWRSNGMKSKISRVLLYSPA